MKPCPWCGQPCDGNECDECFSERMHRENDPHIDWGEDDGGLDDEMDEPTGSCDWCDVNVYDGADLCDQCEWHAEQMPLPREDGTP